ncbi:hypothetical protein WR25_17664 [Diploscapter pachys]|uniref:exodeoxyribonuclease III n=1 Tax=Diploscapter pachys TaxID=2018661 RepID=A0A2A2KWG4_9BILA|nr:hypothetical protein WR25_17664 [Diploscapter pachys]
MPPRKRKASPAAAKGKAEVDKNEREEKADVSAGDELKNDENGSLEKDEKKVFSIFEKRAKPTKSESDESVETAAEDTQPRPWKLICWNVAGLRAAVKKSDFSEILKEDPDVILLEETKCKEWPDETIKAFKGYKKTLLVSESKNGGYAGVALLSKTAPLNIIRGIGNKTFDVDARLIIAEYPRFYFIGAYVPNSGQGLVNLDKRGKWDELFLEKIKELDKEKPIIYGGDLNVAHNEIDLANPESNRNKTAGFTDQEREAFTKLLEAGFVVSLFIYFEDDTYRNLNPDKKGAYTYYSYRFNAKAKNVGWRLDYFVVSERVMEQVVVSPFKHTL